VAYGSHSLTNAERKWSTTEKECFAVVHFMNHWWHFLLGAKFGVVTGNPRQVSWIFGQPEPPIQGGHSKVQQFQPFNVKYWPGWLSNNSGESRNWFNTKQMKPFNAAIPTKLNSSLKDGHYEVKEVLEELTIDTSRRKYKVKWVGYTNCHNSWVMDLHANHLLGQFQAGRSSATMDGMRQLIFPSR